MHVALSELAPSERHAWLTPLITPRPIAFVSTLSAQGIGNLAPFSFFAMGGQNPQSIAFCPIADRHGAPKDTLRNIIETGEFVINIVSRAMAERVNQASGAYPSDVDEFDITGFTRAPSVQVLPPRVEEAPAAMECRLFQLVPHGSGAQHSTWVIGEVVALHVRDEYLSADGRPDTARIQPAARLGRDEWASVTPEVMFRLTRPIVPGRTPSTPGTSDTLGTPQS